MSHLQCFQTYVIYFLDVFVIHFCVLSVVVVDGGSSKRQRKNKYIFICCFNEKRVLQKQTYKKYITFNNFDEDLTNFIKNLKPIFNCFLIFFRNREFFLLPSMR